MHAARQGDGHLTKRKPAINQQQLRPSLLGGGLADGVCFTGGHPSLRSPASDVFACVAGPRRACFGTRLTNTGTHGCVRLCSGRFAATPSPLAFPAAFSNCFPILTYRWHLYTCCVASHPCFGGESEKGRRRGKTASDQTCTSLY